MSLGDVASHVLGASGRAMLQAILAGERDPEKLAALARGVLQRKESQLREALLGRIAYSGHREHRDRFIVNAWISDHDVGVGTLVALRPLRGSQRADLPHWALASGPNAEALQRIGVE